jgi:PAS domain S-box-containing protein
LKESEDKFRSAFENSPMGIALIGPDKRYLKVNKTLCQILGYSEAELKEKTFLDITHPDDFDRDQKAAEKLFGGEIDCFKAEKRYIKKNNQFIWANISFSIIRDSAGDISHAITTMEDITEHKEAEEELRLFRRLIDHSNDSIMIVDTKTARILDVNVKTCLNLGYSRDEFLSMTVFDIDPNIDESLFTERSEEIDKLGSVIIKGIHKRKDGSTFPVEVNITRVKLNRDYGVTIARDITDRLKAEQAIRESEKKYRTIFEESKDTMYISTVDGEFVDVNPAGVELLGYDSLEELMSVDIKKTIYINPLDRKELQDTLKKKGFVTDYKLNLRKKNGQELTVLVTSSVVKDENGKIRGYRGIMRDITKQKELERQLLQAQKMEAIGTLAGGIAHDFNNILGAILGYTELTMAISEENSRENGIIKRNLEQIYRAGLRAKDLIQHILTFSRQTDHKLQQVKVDLILKEALKLLRASLPATIDINQEINENCGYILGDPTQIHQVVMNLSTNAYDAMREKGGVLKVQLDFIEVKKNLSFEDINVSPGKYLKLVVSDTGIGMDDETVKRIFDPFFTTKEAGAGTGLGLSVVHGIVKDHNGEITVDSLPNKGTIFRIYFPEFEPIKENKTAEPSELIPGTEKILYVDDEETLVQTGKQILEKLGYKVTGKTQSMEALKTFEQSPEQFDLVITDLTMPRMTGIDFAKKVLEMRPDIPVILATGYSEEITRIQLHQIGIRDLIMKPILIGDLSKAIRRVLDKN